MDRTSEQLARQKAANALCALESVSLLVGAVNLPEEEDSEFSQDVEAREMILSNLEDNRDTNRGELAARGGIEALCTSRSEMAR